MKPIQIQQIVLEGELDLRDAKTSSDVLRAAIPSLDHANASDICGSVLFRGKDGKFYVGTVEFSIDEANPAYVVDELTFDRAECTMCGHLQRIDDACPIGSEDTSGDCLCDKCTGVCYAITKTRATQIAHNKPRPKLRRAGLK